ncbi:hypothetical protein [Streptomyces sp. CRN 30]|uniref:hypothetical protein n=1 Tax=Streptomyces sp. CRN 30 TaxID=3075613 RepID=UPI002A83D7B3|nr:hypothetical protein [Streptomyces sp. CRN 30]
MYAAANDVDVEEIKTFIHDLVMDFAHALKPEVTVNFAVTVALTFIGGYTLFKLVLNLRRPRGGGGRRSARRGSPRTRPPHHHDHDYCHEHGVCHACHGTHGAHHGARW